MPGLVLEGIKHDFDMPDDGFEDTYARSLIAIRAFNAHRGGLIAALAAIAKAQVSRAAEKGTSRAA